MLPIGSMVKSITNRFSILKGVFNERCRRLLAAAEAKSIGRGGVSAVARATGMSRQVITAGIAELEGRKQIESEQNDADLYSSRIRRSGGGRKGVDEKDPHLREALKKLIEPSTRGDPESALLWTSKSLRHLAQELTNQGHKVSYVIVRKLLKEMGYSLQANQKTREGGDHPDRNAQFEFINERCREHQNANNPVISVDTKKKELVGDFKNAGREYAPKGCPEEVRVHDFLIPELGKANPYGVYDIANNSAWVSVGTDHDTSAFAVEAIRRWWKEMGCHLYPNAKCLQITADGGGSNGSRVRLWKVELQQLSDELGIPIEICHLPPGTSKWNKIEHRLFSFISMNWRGRPLVSHEVIVSLIKATTNKSGLYVDADIDNSEYPTGKKISDKMMAQLNLIKNDFHGEWNYRIEPRQLQFKL